MVKKTSGLAITSFILGIFSLLFGDFIFLFDFLIIFFMLGSIIFGFVALRKIKRNKNLKGKNLAIWGIILGFFWLAIFIIAFTSKLFFGYNGVLIAEFLLNDKLSVLIIFGFGCLIKLLIDLQIKKEEKIKL